MTHGEYLAKLIQGFAGDPEEPRQPLYSGSNEADAVARWLAYHVAMHAMVTCLFVPGPRGRLVGVADVKVWRRWATSGDENVDMTLIGFRRVRGSLALREHKIKVRVNPSEFARRYVFRLSDWRSSNLVLAEGERRDEPHGRIVIEDRGTPYRWTAPRRRNGTSTTGTVRLRPCCRAALQNIDHVQRSFGTYARAVEFFQAYKDSPSLPDFTDFSEHFNVTGRLPDIERRELMTHITLELANHPSGPLHRFWENVQRAVREDR